MTPGLSNSSTPFTTKDWPESRPRAWHALAVIEQATRFASLIENTRDVVLLYHSVGGVPGIDYRWDVPVSVFRDQIHRFSARYELVDLETIATTRDPSQKRVAITFDDGFRSVYEHALPVLAAYDAPATLFVNPAFVDDEHFDELRARHDLPSTAHDVSLTSDQLHEIAAEDRLTLGNHTFSHHDLSELPNGKAVQDEIVDAKHWLEDRFDVSVDRFSYPYGQIDERAAEVAAEAHDIAVTSEQSLVGQSTDPYAIPRLDACFPAATVGFESTDLAARLRSVARRLGGRG